MKPTSLTALLAAWCVCAFAAEDPAYFIFDGSPVAAKYVSGKLIRLPPQDASDLEKIKNLEAVSGLMRASRLSVLSPSGQKLPHLSAPQLPGYGVAMFDVALEGLETKGRQPATLIWSGPARFSEVALTLPGAASRGNKALVTRSRRLVAPMLDFRAYEPVGRRLQVEGPVSVLDHGRTPVAPHLTFVDVTWRIKDLPEALSDRGIDSTSPFIRVEFVIDTATGKTVYQNIENTGGTEGRSMRLLREGNGPLLMAVRIGCSDGAEPLLLDLGRESYGTGRPGDVPPSLHCFPGR